MAQKCVHKGCGKTFTDAEEPCVYHPGPPEFHEGQKGWKCCKPRVLTFDEFLAIPPCTTGKHSTVDDTPKPEPTVTTAADQAPAPAPKPLDAQPAVPRLPQMSATLAAGAIPKTPSPAPEPESEDDDPSLPITAKTTCRRRSCGVDATSATESGNRAGEKCIFHPGHPVFHEGSKGWSCCKRRVLEFDEFLQIQGCQTKEQHMFVGSGKKKKKASGGVDSDGETLLETIRHDFYQTPTTVHASLFLKKIIKEKATAVFGADSIEVDLPTADKTRYRATVPLYGPIDPEKSTMKVLGTKLELALVKTDGRGWPVLRADERQTGEIIQSGKAGRL